MTETRTSLGFEAVMARDPVQRFATWAGSLTGWRRHGLAALLGVLAAAALPPVDLVPLLVVSFSGLVWLASGVTGRREAFALGWSFGFGFFLAGFYWIALALLVDIATYWWLLPPALVALPVFFGIFSGLALLAYEAIGARGFLSRPCALGVAWTACEWLRGHILTGFPWNLVGYAWSGGFPGAGTVLQTTATTGIYGLSLLTVIIAALPASLGDPLLGAARPWRRLAPAGAALLLVAALAGAGAIRLAGAGDAMVPDIRLRLVQPSIAQNLKWDAQERESNFQRLLTLSAGPGHDQVTDVIWPEAAATFYLNRDPARRAAIATVVPRGGLLITGALRTEPPPEAPLHAWNSLVALDDTGAIRGNYDKFHLVPFGEYMPLRSLSPIPAIANDGVDFAAGPGPRTLDLPGLPPVGMLICYEVIFPGEVSDPAHRPAWLLNVTNDAWYGFSSGPFQHFAIARVRAIEEGLPLVRSANNGISGVIDAYGRVVRRLGLDDIGVVDSGLPVGLAQPPLYARLGDWVLVILMLAASLPLLRRRRR
ncbi:MAG TPA: apolipoprotein N-acyltransferase [Stellaceae bacterium]|nr:apolipoprotein N-acyltransferase [Stellaceae bacterium]